LALNIVESVALNMGLRIAYIVNLFNPQLVIVGGGPEKAGDMFFGPARKMVGKLAFRKHAQSIKIIPGALGEDAVSLGAAALAARELFLKA
jgi:glucokinase